MATIPLALPKFRSWLLPPNNTIFRRLVRAESPDFTTRRQFSRKPVHALLEKGARIRNLDLLAIQIQAHCLMRTFALLSSLSRQP